MMNNDYVEAYKHLIGCEFVVLPVEGFTQQKTGVIARVTYSNMFSSFYVRDLDGELYSFSFDDLRLYLDEDTLGTYEEYMELHYKEWL